MRKIIFFSMLSMVASIVFGQLRVGTSGSFGTTTNVPLVFNVNNVKSGSTGSSSDINVSFGYQAHLSSSGANNTAMGYNALQANRNGNYNTATGCSALGCNRDGTGNTAHGMDALSVNVDGGYNSGFGNGALRYNTSGTHNSSLGYWALSNNTSGSYNTAVGFMAGATGSNLSNTTAIGRQAEATSSDQVRIGNNLVGSIGGYAAWSNISDGRIKRNIRADVPGLAFINRLQPVTYNLSFEAIDNLMYSEKQEINDNTFSKELDEREKGVRAAREKQIQTGFVAQDVEKTAKSIGYDFSGVDVDEIGVYSLRYSEFVVPLVKAVQELSAWNDKLQEQNDRMQEQINELKEEVDILKLSPRLSTSSEPITDMPRAILYQNAPNPFSERTVIKFELPDNTANVYIYVFNMQGTLVKQLPINANQSSITINGSELSAGMYLYSLIVNGQEIDTKRMILTR